MANRPSPTVYLPIRTTDDSTHVLEVLAGFVVVAARRRYRDEREHPEFVDIGGESG